MKHELIMENWRNYIYINEMDFSPSANLDIAPLQSASRAMSNKKRAEYSQHLIKLYHPGKTAITPEFVKAVINAAKNAWTKFWSSFGYNKFAELWNSTIGWILPMLPRTDKGNIITEIGYLIFEIIIYIFGFGILFKGLQKIKSAIEFVLRPIAKIPGIKKLSQAGTSAVGSSWRFLKDKLINVVQKIRRGGSQLIRSINQNFESGMYKVFGAV